MSKAKTKGAKRTVDDIARAELGLDEASYNKAWSAARSHAATRAIQPNPHPATLAVIRCWLTLVISGDTEHESLGFLGCFTLALTGDAMFVQDEIREAEQRGDHESPGNLSIGGEEVDVKQECAKALCASPAWAANMALNMAWRVAYIADVEGLSLLTLDVADGDEDAARELAKEIRAFIRQLLPTLACAPKKLRSDVSPLITEPHVAKDAYGRLEADARDRGVHPWDESLAAALSSLGDTGKDLADDVEKRSRELCANASPPPSPGLMRMWADPTNSPLGMPWVRRVAGALWHDRVKPRRAKERARPSVTVATLGPDDHRKVPKEVDGIAWSFGTVGVTGVTIDGDLYGLAPNVVEAIARRKVAVPRRSLIPKSKIPSQRTLLLDVDEHQAGTQDLLLDATEAGHLSMFGAKPAVFATAHREVEAGGIMTGTLREWTKATLPQAKRVQRRDYQRTLEGFRELDRLMLRTPDLRGGYRLFEVGGIYTPAGEAEIGPSDNISFAYSKQRDAELLGSTFRGHYLVNLSGAMAIDNRKPAHFRAYLSICAEWNRARSPKGMVNDRYVARRSGIEWAVFMNRLTPGALKWLQRVKDGTSRAAPAAWRDQASQCAIFAVDALCDLERAGLIVLVAQTRHGETTYQAMPPEQHTAGYLEIRDQGARR